MIKKFATMTLRISKNLLSFVAEGKSAKICIGTSNWPLNAVNILHKMLHPIKITNVLISLSTGMWRRVFW